MSGLSHGALIMFDATPPALLHALPAVLLRNSSASAAAAAAASTDAAVLLRAGDVVSVVLKASKPVRHPNVTINRRPAWVTRTAWDGSAYQVRDVCRCMCWGSVCVCVRVRV